MMNVLLVAVGGAVGAVARYGVGLGAARLFGLAFPWGTLAVNIVGGLAMGLLAAKTAPEQEALRLALGVGVLGGFTTFSSFSLQTLVLLRDGEWMSATANVAASVVVCVIATWAGFEIASR